MYPGDKILDVLNRNHRVGNDLIADVDDQDADVLIDGVTSGMTSFYLYINISIA